MKKRLEADLISIAHRILQLKNKSDINQLYLETQKLHEKLAVLRFVDEHFEEAKPTIGPAEIAQKIESIFENNVENNIGIDPEISPEKINAEEVDTTIEVTIESIESEVTLETTKEDQSLDTKTIDQQTDAQLEEKNSIIDDTNLTEKTESISESTEKIKLETSKKTETVQISFEDLLGGNYTEPKFVKITQLEEAPGIKTVETSVPIDFQKTSKTNAAFLEKEQPNSIAINTKLGKGIAIGLNDRIAFVKHLFGGNSEDYNRVLNQLITFDTFQETKDFIAEMVKPDYNNWDGKEDFEHRFMEIIEKKFLSF